MKTENSTFQLVSFQAFQSFGLSAFHSKIAHNAQ